MTDWAAFTGFTGLVLAVLLSLAHLSRGIPHRDGVDSLSLDDNADERAPPTRRSDSLASDALSNDAESTPEPRPRERNDDRVENGSRPDSPRTDAVQTEPNHGEATRGDSRRTNQTRTDAGRSDSIPGDSTSNSTPQNSTNSQESVERHESAALAESQSLEPLEPTDNTESADSSATEPTMPDLGASSADLPPHLLLANVAISQALLGGLLGLGAWYAQIPPAALGLSFADVPTKLALGVALGVSLYAVNRLGSSVSKQFGFAPDEELRASLTPQSTMGWVLLFVVALPLIAGFEELLFRGALVGAVAAGFDVSPWLMASLSSVAFGLGHGAQGRLGIVVTGLLGFVLAAAFVLTESLLVVVVAHYLVNALEFVGHELLGW
ncbi:hypothetical protein C440_15754 [Haloferax mucosum ATCC BAA-1512]|uniref:CAAX prenyl protease 2/Lysostaphin resistance protein A-like domain-containing protein n=1 Tax=Haloferax mucosum ATCC BAA-1512 TaxID=662479 RepID=M0I4T3_9EURY|nr:CPBP family intramembrane glutamic endopeptidase [Haloferax mucosum]ELZ91781.1 hypothetical protein C440_15754 [Haloferax mucosum ATCC BAA-1512]